MLQYNIPVWHTIGTLWRLQYKLALFFCLFFFFQAIGEHYKCSQNIWKDPKFMSFHNFSTMLKLCHQLSHCTGMENWNDELLYDKDRGLPGSSSIHRSFYCLCHQHESDWCPHTHPHTHKHRTDLWHTHVTLRDTDMLKFTFLRTLIQNDHLLFLIVRCSHNVMSAKSLNAHLLHDHLPKGDFSTIISVSKAVTCDNKPQLHQQKLPHSGKKQAEVFGLANYW